MEINTLRTAIEVLSFLCFLGIVAWAFSARRREAYEQAARLPLDDE